MKTAIVILCVVAAASATYVVPYLGTAGYVRTPALDSSYVESKRIGGYFGYRTVEGHAYQPVAAPQFYSYPAYQHVAFAGPAPFLPYQPAFIEQPAPGLKPIAPMPIAEKPKEFAPPAVNEGRQIDEDTVAVESA